MKWHLFLLLFSSNTIFAQRNKYEQIFQESLNFLIKTQCDSSIEGKQYAGEWSIYMNLTEPYVFIGRKQKARDSNCFNVAAVHNFLSEIYLKDTSLVALKPVLQKAFAEVQSYAVGKKYNFWKLLPPNKNHGWFGKKKLVRRPTNYRLKGRFINKMANVPQDSDDTSLGNTAVFYHNQIFKDSISLISTQDFDEYLDKNRKNRNWYNYLMPLPRNTGAFLTWHYPEHNHIFWTPFHAYFSMMFIFLPMSSAYPVAYESWIPFGANDIDVVVNANVLSYLALSQQANQSIGKKGAIRVIKYCIDKKMWHKAATYYPNEYAIAFATATAFHRGIVELKNSAEKIKTYLLTTQKPNGSFESSDYVNQKDIIQSTAYALHAMLDLRERGIEMPEENINRAVEYLITKANRQDDKCRWEGGIYFSGGTLLRNILIWQSDAYTTALIAKCLQRLNSVNN